MAILVSHAMRRFPNNPPSELQFTKFSALSGEDAEIEDKWRSAADQLPEGSALSRSMRYAEPWLYGGGGGGSPAGGLLLAYAPPALVPAPCSCQDYTNPKSSKKQCKKCKANRISLSHANTVRASKYGTVRGYPTCTLTPSIPQVRAGTVRVSSTSRPTILPSVDPYDLMRRSRLSYPETSNPFGTQKLSQKNPNINLTMTRKSILECNVNPYELMSSSEHKLKQNSGGSPNKQMTNGTKLASNGTQITNEYENIEVRRTNESKIPVKKQVQNQLRTRSKSVEREILTADSNKFKSILKKPSTFNEAPANLKFSDFSQKAMNSTFSKGTPSSHFYLPMPNASRKKVQFLEENQQICQKKDEKEDIKTPILKINGRNPSPEVQENYSAEYEDGDPKLATHTSNERLNQSPTQEISEASKNLDNNFDNITDLQRLDGLGPRQRPKEPPPPPPPPSPPTTNSNGLEPIEKEVRSNRAGTPPPRPYTDGEVQCVMTKNQIEVSSNKQEVSVSSPQTNGFSPENINSQSTPVVPPRKRSNTKKIESIDLENRKNKSIPENSKENSKTNGFQNSQINRSSESQMQNGFEDQKQYQKDTYFQNGYAKEIDRFIKEGPQDSKIGSGTPTNDWNKKNYQGMKISQGNGSRNFGNPPNGTSNGIPEVDGTSSKVWKMDNCQGMQISPHGNVSKNIENFPNGNSNQISEIGGYSKGTPNGTATFGKTKSDSSNIYQEMDFNFSSENVDYPKTTSGRMNFNSTGNVDYPKNISGNSSNVISNGDSNTKFSSSTVPISNGDSFQKSYTYQKFRVDTPEVNDKISITNNFNLKENNSQVKTEGTGIGNGSGSKTVVQITPTKIIPSTIHRLQIHNKSPDASGQSWTDLMDIPQRKTSILINGDDCYSTVNVSDDVPLYQSSVVVNDSGSSGVEVSYRGTKSSVYITGNFNGDGSYEEKKTLVVVGNHARTPSELSDNSLRADYEEKVVETKKELEIVEKKNELNSSFKKVPQKPSSDELQKLLNDPVEAVKRNLVPHVCGKADVDGKTNKKKPSLTPNSLVARLLEDPFLGTLTEGLQTDTVAKIIENSLLKLNDIQNSFDDDKETCSENDSCPPYELIEAGSDCYSNHSNRSSVAEDDMSTRSKFYQLLADPAITEIEDHLYECIRPVVDPIYEEIEIPPPLPSNPPPSSIPDDLQIDKQFTTRSIFEGASKYDILSYLVDAKERGIIPEESYTYSFNNSGEVIVEEELEDSKNSEVFSSRISHLSTVSDSSEDSSLVITTDKGPQKSAEVERNDSGVGSESSKCSRSRYLYSAEQASILCEDCELPVESGDDGPLICRKCSKKRTERKEIITEIVETEEKYSRDLQIILEEFYQPMLVAGLLTPDQLSAIFLNVEELLENSQALAERLRDTVEIALEQGDEDLLTVNIGKIILEAAPMLHAFETYCIRQGAASLLLASLEKEKELLRIFLRVSQMENTMLRRMNLNSFLMVPVQRVTKYPLLLARLYKVTPIHHSSRELIREAQHKIELHLNHMNSETRDVPSKLWRRISNSTGRRSSSEMDLVNIKLRKIAVDVLEWNHDEAKFALEGRLLFTQPTDNNWRKGRTIKLSTINAMLVTHGKATPNRQQERNAEEGALAFPRQTGVREAALLLVRDKGGRYSLLREPLYLDRCVIATDPAWQSYFEVQELLSKDTFIFKAEDPEMTRTWYRQLQYHAQGMGIWRKRRNALANIMINGMGPRN